MRHSPSELVKMMPSMGEIVQGMTETLESIENNFIQFQQDLEACHQARIVGRIEAVVIPAVRFIIDSTLATSALPEVSDRLPDEVHERATIGRAVAATVAGVGVKLGILQGIGDQYEDPADRHVASQICLDSDLLTRLAGAPIYDSAVIIGGSCKILTNEGYTPPEARQIIKNSRGLLVVSGVDSNYVVHASGPLGYPYTESDSFAIEGNPETTVSFTHDAKSHIKKFAGRGCPAGHVRTRSETKTDETTILELYWDKLTDYLITDHVSTDEPVVRVSQEDLEYITRA